MKFHIRMYLFFFSFVVLSSNLRGQEYSIAYYEEQLLSVADSLKPRLHNNLFWKYSKIDIERAYWHVKQGLKIAEASQNKEEEFGLLIGLGTYYNMVGDIKLSLRTFEKALQISYSLSEFDQAHALLTLANLLIQINPQRSFLLFMQAQEHAKRLERPWLSARCYHGLGEIFYRRQLLDSATFYHKTSITILDSIKNEFSINDPLMTLSRIEMEKENFNNALYLANRACTNFKKYADYSGVIRVHILKTDILYNQNQLIKALNQLDSAHYILNMGSFPFLQKRKLQLKRTTILLALKKYDEAYQVLASFSKPNEAVKEDELRAWGEVYSANRESEKAYLVYKRLAKVLKEELSEKEIQYMENIDVMYSLERKRSEEEAQKQSVLSKAEKNRLLYFVSVFFAVVIVFLLIFEITRYRRLKSKQIEHYAFMNAHNVRGPLARILGLVQLMEHDLITPDELPFILNEVALNVRELDTIIKEINEMLQK